MGKGYARMKADKEFWSDFDKDYVVAKMAKVIFHDYFDDKNITVLFRNPLIDDHDWLVSEAKKKLIMDDGLRVDGAWDAVIEVEWFDGKLWTGSIPPVVRAEMEE
jgi:hypothetical protein